MILYNSKAIKQNNKRTFFDLIKDTLKKTVYVVVKVVM